MSSGRGPAQAQAARAADRLLCQVLEVLWRELPAPDRASLRLSCKSGLSLADRQIDRLWLDPGWVRAPEGAADSPCYMEWACPQSALHRPPAVPRAKQARYVAAAVSRGARPHELRLRQRPGEESAELVKFTLRLFKGLSRPGPSASAAAPSLTHLGLEAVPLNGSVLAALTACTPQLLSLRLHGYDLHRKNGVADQLSQPLGLCSRLERFSMEWAISEWARRPSESEHAGFLSLLAGLPSLRSLELRLPPPPLGSHGLAPELELEPPDGSLRGLTCLKLIHAFPEMRPSLARWLGPRPQLVVLHLLPCVLDQSQLQVISEVAGLTELVTCSLKVAPPAAQREGGGAAGSSAATSPAGPLLPSSLPLPPRLRRLGLWHVTAAVLNALALPPSLEQVHLHELRAIEYSQPAPGSDKDRIDAVVLALELLAKSGQYVGALTDREMGVRARDYRRPFKLNMNWTEPPAEIDFEWTSVIERLHLSLLAVDDYDLTSIREKMPQLEHLELQCVLLPDFTYAIGPLKLMRQLRTLVLHPGFGRTWAEWLQAAGGDSESFQAEFSDLLTGCERLTRLQLLLMDVCVYEDDDADDSSAFDEDQVEVADELADEVHDMVYAMRRDVVPRLQQEPGPRQGAEIWVHAFEQGEEFWRKEESF
eukprot:XP_001702367.1 predicted protein [Chlamydomonas reinhardtii]